MIECKILLMNPPAVDPDLVFLRVDRYFAAFVHDFEHPSQTHVGLQNLHKFIITCPLDVHYALANEVSFCYGFASCQKFVIVFALYVDYIVDMIILQRTIWQWNWIYVRHPFNSSAIIGHSQYFCL